MKRLAVLILLALAAPAWGQDKPKYATGYKPLPPAKKAALHAERFRKHGYMMRDLVKSITPPAEFDLKDLGLVGDAGDQASCGSCYLYSTVKTATSSAVKAGYGKVDLFRLSFQFGMDSPRDFGGCNGGNGTEVIDWMTKNGWPAEADPSQDSAALYPSYEARSGRDRTPSGAKKFTPKSWAFVTSDQGDHPATVDEIKAALLTFGRVNIAIDAGGQFGNYQGGVITSMGNGIDHEINIRGWSDAKQALLLENQWKGWGGAKSAGDNCAWVSYKAVGSLQDPFTVFFDTVGPSPTAPVITSAQTATATVGTLFSFQITATNSPTAYVATGLPAGLTLTSGNGLISGTPTAAGSSVVALTATNATGSGIGTLTITTGTTPPAPPPIPGGVSIPLTPEQVNSVIQQSGGVVITGATTVQQIVDQMNAQSGATVINQNMTLKELLEALDKTKQPVRKAPCPCPPPQSAVPPKTDNEDAKRLAKLEADLTEIKRAIDALLKAALKE